MKTLELYDAYYFLRQSAGILIDNKYVIPELNEIQDDYEHEFLILSWEDVVENDSGTAEVYTIEVSFKEKDNQTVGLEGCMLCLTNSDGEQEEITLLQKWHPLVK